MLPFPKIAIALVLSVSTSACVPEGRGEFSTDGKPTQTDGEKLALITGVSDGSIGSISFTHRSKQYSMTYFPDRISAARLKEAEMRMCRYRNLTYDRAGKDEPIKITYEGVPPPSPNPYDGAHWRTFHCR